LKTRKKDLRVVQDAKFYEFLIAILGLFFDTRILINKSRKDFLS
jgi:hypothetical protein